MTTFCFVQVFAESKTRRKRKKNDIDWESSGSICLDLVGIQEKLDNLEIEEPTFSPKIKPFPKTQSEWF